MAPPTRRRSQQRRKPMPCAGRSRASANNKWGRADAHCGAESRTMDVDADRLTEALADRLAAIVPDGFHVRAADGMLWYSSEAGRFPGQLSNYQVGASGTYGRVNFEANGKTTKGPAAHVAAQALSELQDYVDEASHEPWPGSSTPPRPFA